MQKVYAHENRLLVFNARGILEAAGIECEIRNEYAVGGIGDLSPFDAWPEIWVDDANEQRALTLLAQWQQQQQSTGADWVCAHCGETNGAAFEFCWQCGAGRPE